MAPVLKNDKMERNVRLRRRDMAAPGIGRPALRFCRLPAMAKGPPAPYKVAMIPFRKMQGLGNDFVVFDARQTPVPMTTSRARAIADRHFGVGCDTLVLITP